MKASIEFLYNSFDKLNKLYFSDRLPPIQFKLSKSTSKLGCFKVKERRNRLGQIATQEMSIAISHMFDRTPNEIESTLVHEMIHYALFLNGIKDEPPHGSSFVKYMNQINSLGIHKIDITTHVPDEKIVPKYRRNYIIISHLSDGHLGITVTASSKIWEMDKAFKNWNLVESHEWWGTFDPFFSRFPRVIKPKIYPLSREDYEHYFISGRAVKLRIKDNTVQPID